MKEQIAQSLELNSIKSNIMANVKNDHEFLKITLRDFKLPKFSEDMSAQFMKDNLTMSDIDSMIKHLENMRNMLKLLK